MSAAAGRAAQSEETSRQEPSERPVKVVVWDEQQPAQKQAYPTFWATRSRVISRSQSGMSVRSVSINDPGQGLGAGELDDCHVLIWWGHVRHAEIKPETGRAIVQRIKDGKLSLIALHSAHWSTPFVEAMNERTRLDFAAKLSAAGTSASRSRMSRLPRDTQSRKPTRGSRLVCRGASFRTGKPGDRPLTALLLPGLPG